MFYNTLLQSHISQFSIDFYTVFCAQYMRIHNNHKVSHRQVKRCGQSVLFLNNM